MDDLDRNQEDLLELDSLESEIEELEKELGKEPDASSQDEPDTVESEQEDDEVVTRAKKYGHVSKEDWIAQGRDPNQWKSPEEFDKTGKILEQLYSLRHKVEQRDREIAALVDYQQRTAERERAKARQELEQKLRSAEEDMDVAGVKQYSTELSNLNVQEQQSHAQYMEQQRQEFKNQFIEKNKHWYNDQNPDLKEYAAELDKQIQISYPGISYSDAAKMIESRIQLDFPDRVAPSRPRPTLPASQSAVNKVSASKPTKSFKDLPPDLRDIYNVEKRIMESIPGAKEYTHADFIAKLKADGEL